ncbi:MAG: polysaccharide biosynthesis protein, partial [Prevotellaceae bacterium]|nr:polysaccharide biosynthesis protein [Prevotellaceae bacterium]
MPQTLIRNKSFTDKVKKLIDFINGIPIFSKWIILFVDIILFVVSFLITYAIILNIDINILMQHSLYKIAVVVAVSTFFSILFGIHDNILRYSTYRDIFFLFISLLLSNLVLAGINMAYSIYFPQSSLPLVSFFINFVFTFNALFFFRMAVRLVFDLIKTPYARNKKIATLIYGTSLTSIGLAKMIVSDENTPYYVKGFISPQKNMIHKKILRQPVYYRQYFYENISDFHDIKAVIINSNEIELLEKKLLSEICLSEKIKLFVAPSIENWNKFDIKEFAIEDLLGREQIKTDIESISNSLKGKTVLITGAAGSIGSEIVRQVCGFDIKQLVLCDIAETPMHNLLLELEKNFSNINFSVHIADVRNWVAMHAIFEEYRPQYIYHAAAYKHVPMMEKHPKEAVRTNVKGTKIVADLAFEYNSECFVMISTDKAVNPSNVMGASKRIAEIYVRILSQRVAERKGRTRYIITRFGNVLGSNGSVVPLFAEQIKKGGPLTVTHTDIIRYFMTIPEACSLVLEAGNLGKGGEIFVFDMGEPVKIKNLAEEMIRLSGYEPYRDIDIIFS